ncbi:unnamed protein product [Strongylus vulgaris]|uniref:Uncharacterized protein n=1 Tax=Strongylus vulgaris TaxID=40348 RepID=A0A3P7IPL2_STRVU|nr:unnamed protein product [Strongylus vulgaris]
MKTGMADVLRGYWQQIVATKRLYLNPHEHFGRANICRAALASYVGIYFLFKWNQKRKVGGFSCLQQVICKRMCFQARNLRALQNAERKNVLNDALARSVHS